MIFGLGRKENNATEAQEEAGEGGGWLARLRHGLSKTSGQIAQEIGAIFTRRRLDASALEELEEALIRADMGAATAAKIVAKLADGRFDREISPEEIKAALAEQIAALLAPVAQPLAVDRELKPQVIVVAGVNGNGKTTTIGKLAQQWKSDGRRVMLCAADTFRAAAVEQLQIWGERTGCEVIAGETGSDPASVAYRALERAKAERADILIVDTAGRLHNKANLMAELQKIVNVLKKIDSGAPHRVVQVLDATTGQNALAQVETFRGMVNVTGLIVTKLDGTAKAGIVVALAEKFGLPVHAVGVGEGAGDLQPFDPRSFAENLVG